MAKIKKQVKTVDKWKKKKWFTLIAPKLFQERPLGETCSTSQDILVGRTVDVNLMTLTGNIKRQNMTVQFEVNGTQGEQATTHIKKIALVPAFIKRKVRRNKDRIDASFTCKTKDSKVVRIKPMVITLSRSSRATQTALKAKLLKLTVKAIGAQNYDDFVNDVVNYKFQRNMRQSLRTLFPVTDVEVRSTVLLPEDMRKVKLTKVDMTEEPEKEEEPVEDEAEEAQKEDSPEEEPKEEPKKEAEESA